MRICEQLHIDCPPTLAFDLFADVRNMTRWNDGASRADLLTEEPIGPGTRFAVVNRGQELESTITRFDRPGALEVRVTGKAMDVDNTVTFAPSDDGTEVRMALEAQPKGVMKLLLPILKPIVQRDLRAQHRKYAAFCEAQRRQPTST